MAIERNFRDGLLNYPADLRIIKRRINSMKSDWENFKIGKTGKTVEQRFSEPDYDDEYDDIIDLYVCTSKTLVSRMEADLIDAFIDEAKCDNIKDGDASVNDNIATPGKYRVYVVFNNA